MKYLLVVCQFTKIFKEKKLIKYVRKYTYVNNIIVKNKPKSTRFDN